MSSNKSPLQPGCFLLSMPVAFFFIGVHYPVYQAVAWQPFSLDYLNALVSRWPILLGFIVVLWGIQTAPGRGALSSDWRNRMLLVSSAALLIGLFVSPY
jgi:hypothetical protein